MSKPFDPERPGKFSSVLDAGFSMHTCTTQGTPCLELQIWPTHLIWPLDHLLLPSYLGNPRLPRAELSRKYRLSARASDVRLSLLDSMALCSAAREPLRELRAQTRRTASLSVLWRS
jgi:hypothetical protein